MSTDIILDDVDGNCVTFKSDTLKTTAAEITIDSPARHSTRYGHRRAIVHDTDDGLTLNFGNDYPGGLTLNSANINLKVHTQNDSTTPKLPKSASSGDLFLVNNPVNFGTPGHFRVHDDAYSLWICVGTTPFGAMWRQIDLGEIAVGTE